MIAVDTMRANVFHAPDDIRVEEVERPRPGPGEAVIRVTLTTICGTDLHIVRGEYPVSPGLVIGHEPVGVIEELGRGRDRLRGRRPGAGRGHHPVRPVPRLPVRAPVPVRARDRLRGHRRLAVRQHDQRRAGRVPARPVAQANLAKIPDDLTDEQVVLLADIASTGFAGAESGGVRIGDAVVVFAQGPIGLCATAGAKLMGAAPGHRRRRRRGPAGDGPPDGRRRRARLHQGRRRRGGQAADRRRRRRRDRGAGHPADVRERLRWLRPGGTLSSLGVYSGKLQMPYDAFAAGLGDHRIVTTLCPGGKERMGRLIAMVRRAGSTRRRCSRTASRWRDIGEAYALQQPPGRRPEGGDHPVAIPSVERRGPVLEGRPRRSGLSRRQGSPRPRRR